MEYTHYLPATGERGTKISIPPGALRNKDQFEKAVGRLVSEFDHISHRNLMSESTSVKLMDGTKFYFFDMYSPSSVFKKEDGTMIQGHPDLPVCSEDPTKTTRVSIKVSEGNYVLTPFAEDDDSNAIIVEIAIGHGATFYDERGRLTVIPYHNIQEAHVITSPYGG